MPGADVLHAVQTLLGVLRQNAVHFRMRRFGEIYGRAPLAQYLRERTDVIAVFVGNNDAVEPVDVAFDCGKAPQRFLLAKPCINQEPGPLRFEQRAVARASRSQYRNAQTDSFPQQVCRIMTKCGAAVNEDKAVDS